MDYFAYGSNMDFPQMKERCPSAQFICKAVLKDHKLAFPRRSKKRNCGVADAVYKPGSSVWGVVYNIDETDLETLDKCEGYRQDRTSTKNPYNRKSIQVFRDGNENDPMKVYIYFATPQDGKFHPNHEYKQRLVDGAERWGLPKEYIDFLKLIEENDQS